MTSSIRYRFMIALFLIIMLALFTQNGNIFERNSLKFQHFPNVIPVCRGVSFVFRKVLSGGEGRCRTERFVNRNPCEHKLTFGLNWSILVIFVGTSDILSSIHTILYVSGGCGRSSMRYTIELSERSLTLCHYSFVLLPAEAAAIVI